MESPDLIKINQPSILTATRGRNSSHYGNVCRTIQGMLSGFLLVLGSAALVVTGFGQRVDPTPPQIGVRDDRTASFRATNTITGIISGIHHQSKSLSVIGEKDEESWAFFFISKPKMKAKRSVKKALGKKRVEWADLQDGFRVKITFLEATREIQKIEALDVGREKVKAPIS